MRTLLIVLVISFGTSAIAAKLVSVGEITAGDSTDTIKVSVFSNDTVTFSRCRELTDVTSCEIIGEPNRLYRLKGLSVDRAVRRGGTAKVSSLEQFISSLKVELSRPR